MLQMVGLYNDPEGKNVFTMTSPQTNATKGDTSTIETLRHRIRELEIELDTKVAHSSLVPRPLPFLLNAHVGMHLSKEGRGLGMRLSS